MECGLSRAALIWENSRAYPRARAMGAYVYLFLAQEVHEFSHTATAHPSHIASLAARQAGTNRELDRSLRQCTRPGGQPNSAPPVSSAASAIIPVVLELICIRIS